VCLGWQNKVSHLPIGLGRPTLINATYGPTVSITEMKSELLVTSTLTQRLDLLRSMVSRSCLAAPLEKFPARWAYVC